MGFGAIDLPLKKTDHSMVAYQDYMYVYGGRGEHKQILGDFRRYHFPSNSWQVLGCEGNFIKPRFAHSAVVF